MRTLTPPPMIEKNSSQTLAQETERGPVTIQWYRTKLDKKLHTELHTRSDFKGFLQSGGYLAVVMATGTLAGFLAYHSLWGWFAAALLLHGTVSNFMFPAVHELSHGTVFKTKIWNVFFARIFAWLGWLNYELFDVSHARHHRYTLHDPDDLEVVLPLKIVVRDFFLTGFVNPKGMYHAIYEHLRLSLGIFKGRWENKLFPEGSPTRRPPIQWSRLVLFGHAVVLLISSLTGWWWLFVIVSMVPLYGGWLALLLANTQHIGLQDHVSDFRLCCRTMTVNPIFQFLYWHMNYHTEHHMYAAVPCYHLGKLHRAIRHELPPISDGLIETWIEIAYIQRLQKTNPEYQHVYNLPQSDESMKLIAQQH